MRIAVCDDDKASADVLVSYIQEAGGNHAIDVYYDPVAVLNHNKTYEVMFLDIDMPKMNGIELGNAIRRKDKKTAIIYLTNMSEYRSMAFGVHAFDYIEKPVSLQKVKDVLIEIQSYQEALPPVQTVSFKSKEGIVRVPIQDILYFEFFNRHVKLHTFKQSFTLITTLYKVRETLQDETFISPHKSFFINMEHVRLIKGYDIYMVNDDVIPLSQKRASEFRASLNRYLSKRLHTGERL